MGNPDAATRQARALDRARAQERDSSPARVQAAQQQIAWEGDALRALMELARVMSLSPEPRAVVEAVLVGVERIFETRDVWLLLYDEGSGRLQLRGRRNYGEVPIPAGGRGKAEDIASSDSGQLSLPADAGAVGYIFTNNLPLYLADATVDDRISEEERKAGLGQGSLFGVPLAVGGNAIGVLGLDSDLPLDRGRGEAILVDFLGAFAAQAAAAIQSARWCQGEREARTALAALDQERQAQARATERLKDDFISMVSHELRTPLTAIKGCSRTLIRHEQLLDAETRRQFLRDIDEETERLQQLVENLLDLSRAEAGALQVNIEPTLVGRAADKVVTDLRQRRPDKQFLLQFPEALPPVDADPLRLEQVLRNLIDNAVKYSPPNAEVRLSGSQCGDHVVVEIFNPGEGIPGDQQQRIFERFSQVPGERSRRGGAGLGLAICRRLLELQAGRIWVSSQPGEGARFSFSLPVARV